MLVVQVSHLSVDIGWAMGAAIILGINVGWALVFEHVKNGRMIAIIVAPVLLYGNWQSVEASKRAFAEKKHSTIQEQNLGPVARMQKTQMIIANNAMVDLSKSGVSSGAEFEQAKSQFANAQAQYTSYKNQGDESAAAKAMQGGDDSVNIDEAVANNSASLAWLLELMCTAMSVLVGIGTGASAAAMGMLTPTKKQSSARAAQ